MRSAASAAALHTGYCAGTYVGSCVCMSMTEPYAEILPSPSMTRMVTRRLGAVNVAAGRAPAMLVTTNFDAGTLSRTLTWPGLMVNERAIVPVLLLPVCG